MKALHKNVLPRKVISALFLLMLFSVVVYDSRYHFDSDLIHLKRQHKSAQKNWNVFYDQRYVYADSGFRYESDFNAIAKLITPGRVFLSDISTSYYASTYLPAYVKNIHRHHGRHDGNGIHSFLNTRQACYLQDSNNVKATVLFFKDHNTLMRKRGLPELQYILVNRDVKNLNLRQDCLWTAKERLIKFVGELAELKFEGDYLNLYEIKPSHPLD